MSSSSFSTPSAGGAAHALQEAVHGLVEEFFEMLGDGEARFSSPHKKKTHNYSFNILSGVAQHGQ